MCIRDRCARVEVTSTVALSLVLDRMGLDYRILSQREADIYGELSVTELVEALKTQNCSLISIKERDESIERCV